MNICIFSERRYTPSVEREAEAWAGARRGRWIDGLAICRSASAGRRLSLTSPHPTIDDLQANGDGMTQFVDLLEDMNRRREEVLEGGGADKLAQRREKGLMTARDRLDALFQEDTFQELGTHVRHSARYFGMETKVLPADGVVAGTGYVGGRVVAAFSQDFTVVGGSLGKMHAKKIVMLMQQAAKLGSPGRRVQGFRRRPHPGGRRRAVGLRRRLLHERARVRRRAADRRGLRPLRGRRRLFAGADGLHHHDPEERLHVHHRAGSDQGGDRQGRDDGRRRQRRYARIGVRQRAFPRRGRRRRHPHRHQASLAICLRTTRRIRRTGRTPIS